MCTPRCLRRSSTRAVPRIPSRWASLRVRSSRFCPTGCASPRCFRSLCVPLHPRARLSSRLVSVHMPPARPLSRTCAMLPPSATIRSTPSRIWSSMPPRVKSGWRLSRPFACLLIRASASTSTWPIPRARMCTARRLATTRSLWSKPPIWPCAPRKLCTASRFATGCCRAPSSRLWSSSRGRGL